MTPDDAVNGSASQDSGQIAAPPVIDLGVALPIDLTAPQDPGKTALQDALDAALKKGNLQLAQELLTLGADPNALNSAGGTGLADAVKGNDAGVTLDGLQKRDDEYRDPLAPATPDNTSPAGTASAPADTADSPPQQDAPPDALQVALTSAADLDVAAVAALAAGDIALFEVLDHKADDLRDDGLVNDSYSQGWDGGQMSLATLELDEGIAIDGTVSYDGLNDDGGVDTDQFQMADGYNVENGYDYDDDAWGNTWDDDYGYQANAYDTGDYYGSDDYYAADNYGAPDGWSEPGAPDAQAFADSPPPGGFADPGAGPDPFGSTAGPDVPPGPDPFGANLSGPDPFGAAPANPAAGSSFLTTSFTAYAPPGAAASLSPAAPGSLFFEPSLLGTDSSVYGTKFFSPAAVVADAAPPPVVSAPPPVVSAPPAVTAAVAAPAPARSAPSIAPG